MNGFEVSAQALKEANAVLSIGAKSGPSFEETKAQDQQKAYYDQHKQQQDLIAKQNAERMKLGAKAEEAVMKNEMAMQQSRESNALDLEKHKMTTAMQARQPQQAQPNQTAQTAMNNQYHNNESANQVPRYLGNYV